MQKNFLKFSIYATSVCLMVIFMTNCKKDVLTNTPENVAQTPSQKRNVRRCASSERLESMLEAYPEMRLKRQEIEEATQKFVADYDKTARARAVINIPVVFHIVWKTAAQNVSDAQVVSQLKALNDDFRKLNADITKVPIPFKSLAADVEINFVLAKQDPSGKATTGIIRKQTNNDTFDNDDSDEIVSAVKGGSDIWNRDSYLNIYVCELSDDLLGYAQFPGSSAAADAVVVNYKAFGVKGSAEAPYNLGRTTTHEVGHWLNLEHIFAKSKRKDQYGNPYKNDTYDYCGDSDLVSDTPNQAIENNGVPKFPSISCGNTPHGDMFMNYMDYSDDVSLYMFSNGQKARMQALFAANGDRVKLLSSKGASAPTTTPTTPACVDIYEANNTSATAKSIAINTTISANIGTSIDVDWFTFTNTSTQKNIKITLNNLPADYDVILYRNNVEVDYSENQGTAAEQIVLNNAPVGTYKIKVVGYNDAFNASNCYALKAQIANTQFFMVAKNDNTSKKKERADNF